MGETSETFDFAARSKEVGIDRAAYDLMMLQDDERQAKLDALIAAHDES